MKEEFKVILSDHDLSTDDDCSYGIVVQTIDEHPNTVRECENLTGSSLDALLRNISYNLKKKAVGGFF